MNQALVARSVCSSQIFQKPFSLANKFHQASAGMKVLFVLLKMGNQLIDSFSQNSYLHFRRARVSLIDAIFLDNFRL